MVFSPTGTLDVRATISGYDSANISVLSGLGGLLTPEKTFMGGRVGLVERSGQGLDRGCTGL